ncbi:MAG: tRNA pseudouridine(55) synthase TruB [Gammaproteobacteria bacterium]|nr:tRNA pseudouridine(55) synthase TruB [Gammaproteobacteria bacterium]NIR85454.1 tRNA pseudouridine(55) synthase TruB [Gammaproteobacteria bacterium]NIR89506.1 tRNA pseudouridine(55) synthase TruB [Gammaproteobacteria bacterium]NIU06591.1 tRNA pseudouridine(55) synthase TruB [Gammaproteobacteria bacterium]NIV53474.1 tRNA pseudouridine(55) synthase TruB [Gammaproteobacteria bacterium]
MGRRRRKGRDVQGIILLDKPTGMGSNEALQVVKRRFGAKKAGHTGSLDRQASGLLPICLGEATKISSFLLNASKRYCATFRLGVRTTTGDAEGEVVQTRTPRDITPARVERVLEQFRGSVEQVPPMYSAIKHQGQRLYKLAHQGVVVEREPRTVHIHELRLLNLAEDALEVEVYCSKGTYIRTLAEDIGEALGCGGHVASLRRTGAGPFDDSRMVTLEMLEGRAREGFEALDDLLLPMEAAVADWPAVHLPGGVAYYLRKGQPVIVPHAPTRGWVRIYTEQRKFLGVGEVLDDGRIAPRRLVNA